MAARRRSGAGALWLLCALAAAADSPADLTQLSLQELGDLEVTTVSRTPQPLREAAASIFVITQEDIQRSGATTLVEVLQMAPGLHITQFGSSNHSIAARGFSGNPDMQSFSNKLLLLIDGRSVYSPLFSGIYLDTQDVLLADIARIEVITGPGATLWGANAMNGVVNVIMQPAYLTDGPAVSARAGTLESGLDVRYGGKLARDISYRLYAKGAEHDAMRLQSGGSAEDNWRRAQAGFRLDIPLAAGGAQFQGDVYDGDNNVAVPGTSSVTGANLLGRWQYQHGRSALQLQAYLDHVQRADDASDVRLRLNTLDVELQQELQLDRHELVWGAGVRLHRYRIQGSESFYFVPEDRTLHIGSLFAQDTYSLSGDLRLTLGLKLEHNTYTGWEPQPDLRLAWQPADNTTLWAAVSRATRTPTPFEADVVEKIGSAVILQGSRDFQSERLVAFQAGARARISSRMTVSVSGFHHRYNDLRSVEFGPAPGLLPLTWGNELKGHTTGALLWSRWQVTDWWRLSPGVSWLHRRLRFHDGASGLLGTNQAGNDPRTHALLTSSMDLPGRHLLEVMVRQVSRLPEPALPAYTEVSARLAWRASRNWEFSVRGTNLLHRRHREYPAPVGVLIRRGVLAEARWAP